MRPILRAGLDIGGDGAGIIVGFHYDQARSEDHKERQGLGDPLLRNADRLGCGDRGCVVPGRMIHCHHRFLPGRRAACHRPPAHTSADRLIGQTNADEMDGYLILRSADSEKVPNQRKESVRDGGSAESVSICCSRKQLLPPSDKMGLLSPGMVGSTAPVSHT